MGEKKQHYKLYKSGKQWKTLAITAVVAIAGVLSFNDVTANADVTSATIVATEVTQTGSRVGTWLAVMELFNLGLSDGTGHFITLTQQPTY